MAQDPAAAIERAEDTVLGHHTQPRLAAALENQGGLAHHNGHMAQHEDAASSLDVAGDLPLRVEVSTRALLVMYYHAHLSQTEVLGYLGGSYDEQQHIVR